MLLKSQTESTSASEEALLKDDARWALVGRIIVSEGFQRALQLRSILLYVSRSGILRPNHVLSEFEIAHEVLGRRADFNPVNDNIVRAQISHLRHKLEHYFNTEGRDEPLVLTIPKGSYIPAFTPAQRATQSAVISEPLHSEPVDASAESTSRPAVQVPSALPWWKNWKIDVAVLLNLAFIVLGTMLLRDQHSRRTENDRANVTNPFVQFLSRSQGNVKIVVPDTSLVMIQDILGVDFPVSDYISKDFPQRQMAMVKDPAMRRVIKDLGSFRTTSVNEAMIAADFLETLRRNGVPATILYARDLHTRDLTEGNSILIGGPNSDPWMSLFTDQMNFRHVDDAAGDKHFFENRHPSSGEQPKYENSYQHQDVGYVDVALIPNPSQSGYILLINGADMQANEAAARFLLHGRLPSEISSLLARKDLRYFELFLRGKHITAEADDSFELVAVRPK